jgi:hypothetical protein
MTISVLRIRAASRAAGVHLLTSIGIAVLVGALVFGVWYPPPYGELAGGRELFLLVLAVDVICGPLLTLVLFSPTKPRMELGRDLGVVALIQLAALGYGINTVWQVRPIFLVQEIDRFKVVGALDLDSGAVAVLSRELQPHWWKGPQVFAIREPKDAEERNKILFESVQGGRDYAERPEFYLLYEGENALKSLKRAKPLAVFLQKQPDQSAAAQKLATEKKADITQWMYLPVVARQDWVAVLNKQGQIQGFLKGDGF